MSNEHSTKHQRFCVVHLFCIIRKYICKGRVYQQCANPLSLGLALASRLQTLPRAQCVLYIVYIKHCILYISNITYCIFQTLYIVYIIHYMLYARQNRLPLALHSNLTTRPNICTLHCLSISCFVYNV